MDKVENMDNSEIKKLLDDYKASKISIEDALDIFSGHSTDCLGFAHIDSRRIDRCGIPEVIFAEGKTCAQLTAIARSMLESGIPVLATRVNEQQAEEMTKHFKGAVYSKTARTVNIGVMSEEGKAGKVAIITAGTSDIPVAEEACVTAEFLGSSIQRYFDIGVAGIHRLNERLVEIRKNDVAIVIAGMEGALASVVGGLFNGPVIGVPTSVGYGASFKGITALLGMLNSCASNVCTVNIDNGFGAGVIASIIGRMALRGRNQNG